jgi:hypothetical protein
LCFARKRVKGGPPRSVRQKRSLDVVDLDFLAAGVASSLVIAVAILVELEATVAVLVRAKSIGLVDLRGVGKLAVGFALRGVSKSVARDRGLGPTYRERASSAEYLRMTSPFSSWYSRRETRMMSPLLIQIFFRSLPRIRPRRLTPSKHCAA